MVHHTASEVTVGMLLSDALWDQICFSINKSVAGIRKSADQAAYYGSVFQCPGRKTIWQQP